VNLHQIGVDLKANDGKDISKDLFALLMWQANEVPEMQKSSKIGRELLLILLVKELLIPLLCRKGVIDIDIEELDEILHDNNPDDQGHESMPDALGGTTPKDIAVIHIVLQMHCDDLLDLPKGMHSHASISLINIGLPQGEVKIKLLLSKIVQGIAQILNIVEGDSSNALA
jgi:hypothetical protein